MVQCSSECPSLRSLESGGVACAVPSPIRAPLNLGGAITTTQIITVQSLSCDVRSWRQADNAVHLRLLSVVSSSSHQHHPSLTYPSDSNLFITTTTPTTNFQNKLNMFLQFSLLSLFSLSFAMAEETLSTSSHGHAWRYGSGGGIIGFIILILDIIVFSTSCFIHHGDRANYLQSRYWNPTARLRTSYSGVSSYSCSQFLAWSYTGCSRTVLRMREVVPMRLSRKYIITIICEAVSRELEGPFCHRLGNITDWETDRELDIYSIVEKQSSPKRPHLVVSSTRSHSTNWLFLDKRILSWVIR